MESFYTLQLIPTQIIYFTQSKHQHTQYDDTMIQSYHPNYHLRRELISFCLFSGENAYPLLTEIS